MAIFDSHEKPISNLQDQPACELIWVLLSQNLHWILSITQSLNCTNYKIAKLYWKLELLAIETLFVKPNVHFWSHHFTTKICMWNVHDSNNWHICDVFKTILITSSKYTIIFKKTLVMPNLFHILPSGLGVNWE